MDNFFDKRNNFMVLPNKGPAKICIAYLLSLIATIKNAIANDNCGGFSATLADVPEAKSLIVSI